MEEGLHGHGSCVQFFGRVLPRLMTRLVEGFAFECAYSSEAGLVSIFSLLSAVWGGGQSEDGLCPTLNETNCSS